MGKIEWSMWANENALISCIVLSLGGILAISGQFDMWQIGIYGVGIGIIIFLIEYPRGKRQTGTSVERRFQKPFTAVIQSGKIFTRSYFIRFLIYIAASVPCCFILQTLMGAMCLMITSFIYLTAAVKGEEWLPIESIATEQQGPKVIAQPIRPPPRRPDNAQPRQSTASEIDNPEAENRV